MKTFDCNDAGPQKSFDIIPADTIATLHMTVKSGGAGEDGWLRRSKDGGSEALDCEFTIIDGEFAKRKFWTLLTVAGTTEGHATAADSTRRCLLAMLESARGIRPDDKSDAAKEARRTKSWGDFDGLRFIGRIGIEAAKGGYRAKNTLLKVITPDRRGGHHGEQGGQPGRVGGASPEKAAGAHPPPTP